MWFKSDENWKDIIATIQVDYKVTPNTVEAKIS